MNSQVSTEIMESMPRRLTDWLDVNFSNKGTARTYYQALKLWLIYIYGEDSVSILKGQKFLSHKEKLKVNAEKGINKVEEGIERYFSELDDRDFLDNYKRFISWLRDKGYANLTTRSRARCVKIFFGRQKDPRCKIDDEDWAQIKRTLFPKSTRPQTKDEILKKEQLKLVLPELSIHARALALFLLSTGARVGESCMLRMKDLHLDDDPPWVDIQEKYTKDQVGGRLMWMSYEARDAIRDWHSVRINKKKTGTGRPTYIIGPKASLEDLVFDYNHVRGFQAHWNNTLLIADRGREPAVLARRSDATMQKIHIYHVHTLRKFFFTNMRFEGSHDGKSGVPEGIVHGWMGHKGYLEEAYSRGKDRLAAIYKENMHVVTVHEDVGPLTIDEEFLDGMAEETGAYDGLSEEHIEGLSIKQKYLLVKAALVKRKEEKKVPVAEYEMDPEEHDEFMDLVEDYTASSARPRNSNGK